MTKKHKTEEVKIGYTWDGEFIEGWYAHIRLNGEFNWTFFCRREMSHEEASVLIRRILDALNKDSQDGVSMLG